MKDETRNPVIELSDDEENRSKSPDYSPNTSLYSPHSPLTTVEESVDPLGQSLALDQPGKSELVVQKKGSLCNQLTIQIDEAPSTVPGVYPNVQTRNNTDLCTPERITDANTDRSHQV